jgi:hypothetical protein
MPAAKLAASSAAPARRGPARPIAARSPWMTFGVARCPRRLAVVRVEVDDRHAIRLHAVTGLPVHVPPLVGVDDLARHYVLEDPVRLEDGSSETRRRSTARRGVEFLELGDRPLVVLRHGEAHAVEPLGDHPVRHPAVRRRPVGPVYKQHRHDLRRVLAGGRRRDQEPVHVVILLTPGALASVN